MGTQCGESKRLKVSKEKSKGLKEKGLLRLLDFSRFDALGAYLDSLRLAVHIDFNILDIGQPYSLCFIVGMAYIMTELRSFAAYITFS